MDLTTAFTIIVSVVSLTTALVSISLVYRQVRKADLEITKLRLELAEREKEIHRLTPEELERAISHLEKSSVKFSNGLEKVSKSLSSMQLKQEEALTYSLKDFQNGTAKVSEAFEVISTDIHNLNSEVSRVTESIHELDRGIERIRQELDSDEIVPFLTKLPGPKNE